MASYDNATPGEIFNIRQRGGEIQVYVFDRVKRDGTLEFVNEKNRRRKQIKPDAFDDMRESGQAVLQSPVSQGAICEELDPIYLLDPDEPNILDKERDRRRAARRRWRRAEEDKFWVGCWRAAGGISKGSVYFAKLRQANADEAKRRGFWPGPSDSTIARAIEALIDSDTPLTAMLQSRGKHDRSVRWSPIVMKLSEDMIERYWTSNSIKIGTTICKFIADLGEINKTRAIEHKSQINVPCYETCRQWLNQTECHFNVARKYGWRVADSIYRGIGTGLQAFRAQQYVIIDTTAIDAWAAVFDHKGRKIGECRPFLTIAIDVRTRMILAFVITFDPPSVVDLVLCLKQMVTKKSFLFDEYGKTPATDGYGSCTNLLLDNAWAYTCRSNLMALGGVGINVEFAPIRTPQYKSYVERVFRTLNELHWHQLDFGIPEKPEGMKKLGLDPRPKARKDLEWFRSSLWDVIVTQYHRNKHEGIEMAPALAWADDIKRYKRMSVSDMNAFNRFFGKVVEVVIDRRGVRHRYHYFHDAVVTSEVLNDLFWDVPKKDRRKGPLPEAAVKVIAIIDPSDCSAIEIWNPVKKRHQRLPNVKPRYSQGLSWDDAEAIRLDMEKRNQDFHSEADCMAAKARHYDRNREEIEARPGRAKRSSVRSLVKLEEARLVRGNRVEVIDVEPSVSGNDRGDIAQIIPGQERIAPIRIEKGHRRGGKAASERAARTRAKNRDKSASPVLRGGGETHFEPSSARARLADTSLQQVDYGLDKTEADELLMKLKNLLPKPESWETQEG